ncbi:hypothetical protein BD311DRAFT_373645 [Dichomitus squalens]|uniref:Protein kinase domain-containing protein n=1 Tax=Dichomitus squalens TaxID=114155 RepID=A0A4Q9MJB1_9APHY|nr:hypothetical protein BD311DRAFT_373645 [Dichomitus squalens]
MISFVRFPSTSQPRSSAGDIRVAERNIRDGLLPGATTLSSAVGGGGRRRDGSGCWTAGPPPQNRRRRPFACVSCKHYGCKTLWPAVYRIRRTGGRYIVGDDTPSASGEGFLEPTTPSRIGAGSFASVFAPPGRALVIKVVHVPGPAHAAHIEHEYHALHAVDARCGRLREQCLGDLFAEDEVVGGMGEMLARIHWGAGFDAFFANDAYCPRPGPDDPLQKLYAACRSPLGGRGHLERDRLRLWEIVRL